MVARERSRRAVRIQKAERSQGCAGGTFSCSRKSFESGSGVLAEDLACAVSNLPWCGNAAEVSKSGLPTASAVEAILE